MFQSSAAFAPRAEFASWAWSGTHWTDEDHAALKATADAKIDLEKAADHLGRSPKSLAWKANELGIQMPPQWRAIIRPYKRRAPKVQRLAFPYIVTRRPEHETLLFVNSLVPASLPEWIRADICQNIMLGILEGNLNKDALDYATISKCIRRVKGENWDYRTVSLDAPIFGDSDLRLVDTLADDPDRLWVEPI